MSDQCQNSVSFNAVETHGSEITPSAVCRRNRQIVQVTTPAADQQHKLHV